MRQLSAVIKIKNYKIIASFVSLEGPKVRVNENGFKIMIFNLIFVQIACNTMLYKIFQYVLEPVLIQRILLSLEAILKKHYLIRSNAQGRISVVVSVRFTTGILKKNT